MKHCEDPVELPGEPEATEDGPSVPFRLTEAKLCHQPVGDQPYFGRLNLKAPTPFARSVDVFCFSENRSDGGRWWSRSPA